MTHFIYLLIIAVLWASCVFFTWDFATDHGKKPLKRKDWPMIIPFWWLGLIIMVCDLVLVKTADAPSQLKERTRER